ncbi:MAG: peptidoglycan D,D-transpeptidase FtsI family protein [Lachnospiraceae bacterium]
MKSEEERQVRKGTVMTFKQERMRMRKKMTILFMLMLLGLVILSCVFIYIAIFHKEDYSQEVLSRLNYSSTTILAERGNIYDCNMSVVAKCEEKFIVIVDPSVILNSEKNKEETIARFCEYWGCSEQYLRDAIGTDKKVTYVRCRIEADEEEEENSTAPLWIVSYEEKKAWEEYADKVNEENKVYNKELSKNASLTDEQKQEMTKGYIDGIWFDTQYARVYPYASLASKIIGFTSSDSTVGNNGLESYYNDQLSGVNGRKWGYVNSDNSLEQEVEWAQKGNSLVTTIDMNMQTIISRAVERWLNDDFNGTSWQVLIMDPNSGAVKAMASSTDYDLNNPQDISMFYSEDEIYQMALEQDVDVSVMKSNLKNKIWRNTIISDTFEPGSTGKAITMAAALEEDVVNADSHFFCSGDKQVENYMIKCHNYNKGGCGDVDLSGAMAESCNVAFMEIGEALGAEFFAKFQEIFNLGQKTGIDLPGEASGAGLLYEADELGEVELATCAFGQGYNITMLQMAAAYASIINGGSYYKPYVVSKILDENGYVLQETTPEVIRQTVSKETSDLINSMLEDVVLEGTAISAYREGYHIGGKTGTAEKLPRGTGKYTVSFISAAPMNDPQMLVYVVVDEPTVEVDGSYTAQMLGAYIWDELIPYLGIVKDETEYNTVTSSADDSWSGDGSYIEEIVDQDGNAEENAENLENHAESSENHIENPENDVENPEQNIEEAQ